MALMPTRIWAITILTALISAPDVVHATDVRVLTFSFQVPDAWVLDGGEGGDKLFARGGPEVYAPPWVLSEGCVPIEKRDCSNFRRPDLAQELPEACTGVAGERIPRADAIIETRWICSPVKVDGIAVAVGGALFEVKGAILYVAYTSRHEDLPPAAFLDKLSRSLKFRWP